MNKSIGFEVKETANSKEYTRLKKITDFLGLKEFYMVSNNFYEGAGTIIAQDI
jgi:hypothetical protein